MPVLGMAVFGLACVIVGAGAMWGGMTRGIRDVQRQNDDLRMANARMISEVRKTYSERVLRRAGSEQ